MGWNLGFYISITIVTLNVGINYVFPHVRHLRCVTVCYLEHKANCLDEMNNFAKNAVSMFISLHYFGLY